METTTISSHSAPKTNKDFQHFRVVGFEVRTYTPGAGSLLPSAPVPAGTCDYCGTGIKYAVVAEDTRTGGRCDIGTDCAEKIGFTPQEIRNARNQYEHNLPEARARRKAARLAEKALTEAYEAEEVEREANRPLIPELLGQADALFDLAGRLVTTNTYSGQYGLAWSLPNRGGFVSAFPKRVSTMTKKGYYEGTVIAEMAEGRNGRYFVTDSDYELVVVAVIDDGTEERAEFRDHRTDRETDGYHDQSDPENVVWVDGKPAPYADFLAAMQEAARNAWADLGDNGEKVAR